jgi:hypothetical protein
MKSPVSKCYLGDRIKQIDELCGSLGGEMEIGLWWLYVRKERLVSPRHRWEEHIKINFGELRVIWHMTRENGGCCERGNEIRSRVHTFPA